MKKALKIVPKDSPEEKMEEIIREHQSYIDYMVEDFKKKIKQMSGYIHDKIYVDLKKNEVKFDSKEMKRRVDREVVKKIISSL